MAGSVTVLVLGWRLFSRPLESDRSLKFLRAAYVWLLVSLAMLVLLPAYQYGLLAWQAPESAAVQIGFSHAYYGAIRHAITVGFISLMIVGMAAKAAPTRRGPTPAPWADGATKKSRPHATGTARPSTTAVAGIRPK